jgi:transcription elongation factor Elf1
MNHEFRCPVCSHSDVVDLPRGESSREVPCSHCGTDLTLELRGDAELALEVRVATPGEDGAAAST